MSFFGMFNGNIEQLNPIWTVNISAVSVGLFLKIIFHFKHNTIRLSHGNKMTDRREIRRVEKDRHLL
jgi:uncharacterized membrane protein (DUF106 family)